MNMDDVNERLEELCLSCMSECYNLKAGSSERQREIANVENLVKLLHENEDKVRKYELEEKKLQIEQDRVDNETIKNRDELVLRQAEIEQELRTSKRRLVLDIIRCAGSEIGVPLIMLADEHSDRLLPNRIFKFWSKPKV